jgi:hypothetical protein
VIRPELSLVKGIRKDASVLEDLAGELQSAGKGYKSRGEHPDTAAGAPGLGAGWDERRGPLARVGKARVPPRSLLPRQRCQDAARQGPLPKLFHFGPHKQYATAADF